MERKGYKHKFTPLDSALLLSAIGLQSFGIFTILTATDKVLGFMEVLAPQAGFYLYESFAWKDNQLPHSKLEAGLAGIAVAGTALGLLANQELHNPLVTVPILLVSTVATIAINARRNYLRFP